MSQNALVKQKVGDHLVQVALMRQLECGLSCHGQGGGCASCGMRPKEDLLALAYDPLGLEPGDFAEVDSRAGGAIPISLLVFGLPLVTLIAGYLVGDALGLGEGNSLLTAFAGLALGFVPAWLYNRKVSGKRGPEFTVLRKLS